MTTPTRIIRINEVLLRAGISRSTLYVLINAGNFPKRIKLGKRIVGFNSTEFESWLLAGIGGEV